MATERGGRPGCRPSLGVRRRRLVAVLGCSAVSAGVLLGLLGGGPLGASEQPPAGPIGSPGLYVARPGDTLWSIATRAEPGVDPRPLVERLARQVGGDDIQVGQTVRLPTR